MTVLRMLLPVLLLWCGNAWAVNPDERLADPTLEARARALSKELRCMVCQNESIDDSNADLAHDLRVIVRQRLVAGDTDPQVLDYMRARYGDFVLLRPPVDRATWVLWFGPFAVLLAGGGAIFLAIRTRRSVTPAAALSDDERSRLEALLNSEPDAP
jgi:cytochrome c-type biogenesis protein CcmH